MKNLKMVQFLLFIAVLNAFLFLLLTKFGDITAFLITMMVAHGLLCVEDEKQ